MTKNPSADIIRLIDKEIKWAESQLRAEEKYSTGREALIEAQITVDYWLAVKDFALERLVDRGEGNRTPTI